MGDCFQTKKCWTVVTAFLRAPWIGISFGVAEYSKIHTQNFEVLPSTLIATVNWLLQLLLVGLDQSPISHSVKLAWSSFQHFFHGCVVLSWMYEIGQPWLNYFKLPMGTPWYQTCLILQGKAGQSRYLNIHIHGWHSFFCCMGEQLGESRRSP